jgi:hypothetical protein
MHIYKGKYMKETKLYWGSKIAKKDNTMDKLQQMKRAIKQSKEQIK